jgi:outer membrane protein assembly factor BamB
MWNQRDFGHGSILPADGKLIILGEKSQLALAEISPEAYKEISRAELITGKTWTIPTIANGKMYVRNEKEIVCVDLKEK